MTNPKKKSLHPKITVIHSFILRVNKYPFLHLPLIIEQGTDKSPFKQVKILQGVYKNNCKKCDFKPLHKLYMRSNLCFEWAIDESK
jgi:hypothetical protein